MSSRWMQAFKEIHGRSPSKDDFMLAPIHIREELLGTAELDKEEEIDAKPAKRTGVRLKRPADDEFSPCKPLPKRQALDSGTTPTRSLKKSRSLFTIETKSRTSLFTPEKKRSDSVFVAAAIADGLRTPTRSPQKMMRTTPQIRTRSSFFTPEKTGPDAMFVDDMIPEVLKTPIRSPQKMMRTALQIRNVDALLAPTPEKKPPAVEEQPLFEAEDVPEGISSKKTAKRVVGGAAKVFDPTTGRIIARPFKTQTDAAPEKKTRKPKEKGNFVRINLRKKSFTRGKVSAEAKRKLKRKQMWKKRFNK